MARRWARVAAVFGADQIWHLAPTKEGNTILIAGRDVVAPDRETMQARSAVIEERFGLKAGKWLRLVRLPQVAVTHEGHAESNRQMVRRLWRNGRAKSLGPLLRSAWGQPWFGLVVRKMAHVVAVPLLHLGTLALAFAVGSRLGADMGAGMGAAAWLGAWLAVAAAMTWRKRSLRVALWHLFLWHYWAIGTLCGLRRPVGNPLSAIPATELTAPAATTATAAWQPAAASQPQHAASHGTPGASHAKA